MKTIFIRYCNIFFYLILFLTFFNSASGQSNFKKGKIVTLNSDTILGMIEDQNKLSNPWMILFTPKDKQDAVSYGPSEIKASIIDSGDYYLSAVIEIDMNYGKAINMGESNSVDSVLRKDTVFLRVLLQSKMSLYLFTDENLKNHFYYRKGTSSYSELTFKNIPITIDKKTYLKKSTRYKNQLTYLMSDSPEAVAKINDTEYNEKELLELFELYNSTFNDNFIKVYGSKKKSNSSSIFAIVGLDITQMKFKTTSENFEENDFSTSYRPTIGMCINIPVTRSLNKYSLLIELDWKQFDTKSHYFINYYEYNLHFRLDYLKLITAFRYKFIRSKFNPYVQAGPEMTLLISSNFERSLYNHNPNISSNFSRESIEEDYIHPKNLGFGLLGGIGINYKKFGFEVRYEKISGFIDASGIQIESLYFLFLYKLSKE